jgi:hypothetical protein
MIQRLLTEAGANISSAIDNPDYDNQAQTPELYLGYTRADGYSFIEALQPDQVAVYTSPETIPENSISLTGEWLIDSESAHAQTEATLQLHFMAKEVFLVMSATDEKTIPVTVYLDDQVVTTQAGTDVTDGIVTVTKDRLYHLLSLDEAGQHTLKLEFPDGQVQVFAFTFG